MLKQTMCASHYSCQYDVSHYSGHAHIASRYSCYIILVMMQYEVVSTGRTHTLAYFRNMAVEKSNPFFTI